MSRDRITPEMATAAFRAWGCRRPDKMHHFDEDSARRHLRDIRRRGGESDPVNIYQCCTAGWVWGRPNRSPEPIK